MQISNSQRRISTEEFDMPRSSKKYGCKNKTMKKVECLPILILQYIASFQSMQYLEKAHKLIATNLENKKKSLQTLPLSNANFLIKNHCR